MPDYYLVVRRWGEDELYGPYKNKPLAEKAAELAEGKQAVAYANVVRCGKPAEPKKWADDYGDEEYEFEEDEV